MAFSGGADSSALLHMLVKDNQQAAERVVAGYVHHDTGKHADEAGELTRKVATDLDVVYSVAHVHVSKADKKASGFEAAARALRYDALDKMAEEHNCGLIVTGHTADDLAEGVLLYMMRGAGIGGLAGAREDTGRYFRPLLKYHHEELVQFLKNNGLAFIEDPSNQDVSYHRNRIRHRLRPLIEKEFGDSAWNNLAVSARFLENADQVLDDLAEKELQKILTVRKPGWLFLAKAPLVGYLQELRVRILDRALRMVYEDRSSATYNNRKVLERLANLLYYNPGTSIELPSDITAQVTDTGLIVDGIAAIAPVSWNLPGSAILADGSALDARRLENGQENGIKNSDRCVEYVDAEAFGATVKIRPWRRGDRMQAFGMDHERKISDLDSGASYKRAGPRWVVETERGIAWSIGSRIADWCRVTENTRQIWRLTYQPSRNLADGEQG